MITYDHLQALIARQFIEWDEESASWSSASMRLLFGLMPLTACPGAITTTSSDFLRLSSLVDIANSFKNPTRFASAGIHRYLSTVPGLAVSPTNQIEVRQNAVAMDHHAQVLLHSGLIGASVSANSREKKQSVA